MTAQRNTHQSSDIIILRPSIVLTVSVELPHRIDNGKVPVAGQRGQREYGHPGRQVVHELGQLANLGAPRPRLRRIHDRDERQRRTDDDQVGDGQRENVPVCMRLSMKMPMNNSYMQMLIL